MRNQRSTLTSRRLKFDREFENSRRVFNVVFGIALTFIVVVFIGLAAFYIFVGSLALNAASDVQEHGAKAVIERIWCGPDNKCL